MEVDRLRKIIREEIHKAFQEEIRATLIEAVQIASTPVQSQKPVVEVFKGNENGKSTGLFTLLNDTARSMTKEDYHDILGGSGVVQTEQPQLTESFEDEPNVVDAIPDFAKRAGEIFKKSLTIKK